MTGRTNPLYIVCSPCRCIGKTLVARLLTEFQVLNDRRVAAFDLADEGPQLKDYLPQLTTIGDITDIFGQVWFFERLIADKEGARIIDLSYRSFEHFFNIVEEIGFFEEARCRSIEPLILFIVDASTRSRRAYANLHQRLSQASIVPVRNRTEVGVMVSDGAARASTTPISLEIPLLRFALRAQIDQPAFSFCNLWQTIPRGPPDPLETELRKWLEEIFVQIRSLELAFDRGDPSTPVPAVGQDGLSLDQRGDAVVDMLQRTSQQMRAAKDQIHELETQIEHIQDRARTWLQLLAKGISGQR